MAVEHWRSYLQAVEFIMKTDQKSMILLDEERLHTYWQQKALTKLIGLQYKICYKNGASNAAADALQGFHMNQAVSCWQYLQHNQSGCKNCKIVMLKMIRLIIYYIN